MGKIAIIDFGGQYTHLIARRIRNLNVYSEIIHPEDFQFSEDFVGIILSGGPQSVIAKDAYRIDYDISDSKVPILGICYGHQLLAKMLGGTIGSKKNTEYGPTNIQIDPNSTLFANIAQKQQVWMSHGDYVQTLPNSLKITASSSSIPIAAFESKNQRYFGFQFHPEVSHSLQGMKMLDNFVSLCTQERNWDSKHYKNSLIKQIQEKAKGKKLILLLSGGVDSLVALELCLQVVGRDSIYSYHIDTGFMRKNESEELALHFAKLGYENIEIIQAELQFLSALKNITEPELKREIIGKLFIDIVHKKLEKFNTDDDWLLVQGTIYPDTIESGSSKKAAKIKTHHNRVEEIEKMIKEGKVIEPLQDLYKDEVRELGRELGLPETLVNRQPFPGPGLAIRIICNRDSYQESHTLRSKNIESIALQDHFSYSILPIKSVGVQGDFRTYAHPTVIWPEERIWSWNSIRSLSSKIINSEPLVNRVMISLSPIENVVLDELLLEKENIDKLRDVDAFFRKKTDQFSEIWQMPVVQLPISINSNPCYVIRPICSIDAMTADFYEMEKDYLEEMIQQAKKQFKIGEVFYDVTSKPPGTIEWE